MSDLLDDPQYFLCEATHCKLRLAVCLGRQKANRERKGFDTLPHPECEKCGQGEQNKALVPKEPDQGKPHRGQGKKNVDCDSYEACLDYAANKDWKSFNCEACPLNQAKEEKEGKLAMTEIPKAKSTKICEECKERPTLHPNSSLCGICMGKRKKPRDPSIKSRKGKKGKGEYQGKDPVEIVQPGRDLSLTIDFREYASVLDEVTDLAEDEIRPVDLQVIFMLREYLKGLEVEEANA